MSSYPHLAQHLKAIIFDLDGTLVSSSLDFKKIREDIGCPLGVDVLEHIDGLDPIEQEQAHAIVRQHEQRDAEEAVALDGVTDMLDQLNSMRIQTGIVTRNAAHTTQIKLQRAGLDIEHVLTREDAAPKPDPEALLCLSKRWQLDATQCLYVGDFRYDIEAAHNAGMHACLYASYSVPDYFERADILCRDWRSFLDLLESYCQARSKLSR